MIRLRILLPAICAIAGTAAAAQTPTLPAQAGVLTVLRRVNGNFMQRNPDPATTAPGGSHPGNGWTRGVYYEGLMALYSADSDAKYYNYAVRCGESYAWGLNTGPATRHADNQCIGQAYLDLYERDPKPERIRDLQTSIAAMAGDSKDDDWWWVDALQMAMPAFARLGALNHDSRYFEKMYALYINTKMREGGTGLYNPVDHLWWRDRNFLPPYKEPNGSNCYWARGNGWALAALARVLEVLPENEPHRDEYVRTFREMAAAIKPLQRPDGFWNVSLKDPGHFPGKETTGTSLFVYGLAAGIRMNLLNSDEYLPTVARGWNAMASDAVRPDGSLGYVQGVGKQPSDSQPVTFDRNPEVDDFAVGCFLLAGTEIWKLSGGQSK